MVGWKHGCVLQRETHGTMAALPSGGSADLTGPKTVFPYKIDPQLVLPLSNALLFVVTNS